MKTRRSKACDISQAVKKEVFARDDGKCIFCGNMTNVMPNAHYIPRSDGGLGIPENIITACTLLTENKCHHKFDNGTEREEMRQKAREYLKNHYPDWDEKKLFYSKWR